MRIQYRVSSTESPLLPKRKRQASNRPPREAPWFCKSRSLRAKARARAAEFPRHLLDINIIPDLLLDRAPWSTDAATLLGAAFRGRCATFVASHSITSIHYLVERRLGKSVATSAVSDLLALCTVVPLNDSDFHRALAPGVSDFEHTVAAALHVGAKCLVTRNAKDSRGAPVSTRSAGEILAMLKVSSPTNE